jgi:pimeloyl-ACP methyl ester carboxylesterase
MGKSVKGILIAAALLCLLGGVVYYWFPGWILESTKYVLRWWADLDCQAVQVDDHRWVYLSGGEGKAVLLVHGFGADKDRWGLLLPAFSRSYRVVVPDLPGFGQNSKLVSATYDIPTQVRRLNRFVEAINLDSFYLVGISMGGYISAYFAGQYPQKVKGLVLLDAAGVDSPVPSHLMSRYRATGKMPLLYRTRKEFDELMEILFFRPPWIPGRLRDHVAQQGARDYEFREKILREMVAGGMNLLEGRLNKINAKTLLIWGAEDRVLHVSSVEKFQKGLRHCRTVIIKECGHVPYVEKLGETRKAIMDFLEGLK